MENQLTTTNQSPTPLDFSIIINGADQKVKRNGLLIVTGKAGKAFNQFVLASVRFFYGDGNKQIKIINDLFIIAHQSKGMNAARLASYLKNVVPHKLEEGDNKTAPSFGKKTKEYNVVDAISFITDNNQWYTFGRPPKSTDFDLNRFEESVLRKLTGEGIPIIDFTAALLQKNAEKTAIQKAAEVVKANKKKTG